MNLLSEHSPGSLAMCGATVKEPAIDKLSNFVASSKPPPALVQHSPWIYQSTVVTRGKNELRAPVDSLLTHSVLSYRNTGLCCCMNLKQVQVPLTIDGPGGVMV